MNHALHGVGAELFRGISERRQRLMDFRCHQRKSWGKNSHILNDDLNMSVDNVLLSSCRLWKLDRDGNGVGEMRVNTYVSHGIAE